MASELTIGALAKRTGVSVSFLRFYESVGLLRPKRSTGNQRRYPEETVALVEFIQTARRAGLPISLIAKALHAPGSELDGFSQEDFCDELCTRMRALLHVHRDVDQIARMCDQTDG